MNGAKRRSISKEMSLLDGEAQTDQEPNGTLSPNGTSKVSELVLSATTSTEPTWMMFHHPRTPEGPLWWSRIVSPLIPEPHR